MTKGLGDPGWRLLLFHEFDISRIAELAGQFCYPAAGNTDKVDILQLGLAYMPWVG
jgi:hypothetical protein